METNETKLEWEENFRNSKLVLYGRYNQSAACQLFWNSNPCIPGRFSKGFRYFHDQYDFSNPTKELDLLIDYLDYIGIKIRREAILEVVYSHATSFPGLLKRCFFLFRGLAMHRGHFDINDPFKKNLNDIQFLLDIEAGIFGQQKPRRLTFVGRRPSL